MIQLIKRYLGLPPYRRGHKRLNQIFKMSGYDISIPPRNRRGLKKIQMFGVLSSTANFNSTPVVTGKATKLRHGTADFEDIFQSRPATTLRGLLPQLLTF